MRKILVNFLAHPDNLARFDQTCRAVGRTRTSVLTQLMDHFCVSQISELNAKNATLRELDGALLEHRRLKSKHEEQIGQHHDISFHPSIHPHSDQYDVPVGIMYSNGEEFF